MLRPMTPTSSHFKQTIATPTLSHSAISFLPPFQKKLKYSTHISSPKGPLKFHLSSLTSPKPLYNSFEPNFPQTSECCLTTATIHTIFARAPRSLRAITTHTTGPECRLGIFPPFHSLIHQYVNTHTKQALLLCRLVLTVPPPSIHPTTTTATQ